MQSAGLLLLAVQIAFAVHAIRRGYPLFWVFLIVFVPLFGIILYVIMVIIPELGQSRAAARGGRALRKALDPDRELRELRQALEISDTIGNRVALAKEYARQGKYREAIELYESSLTGMYREDPDLLQGLAAVLVAAGDFGRARELLETLYRANPDTDSAETRLLYARSLEATDATEAALAAYAAAVETYPGAEARYRYGALLKRLGRTAEARQQFEEILRDDRAGSRHSRELNREWLALAKKELG